MLQFVFEVSHTNSMVYVCTGRKTEVRIFWRRTLVMDLAVCAVVDSTLVSILRRHVVVRRRSIQAEDPDESGSKTFARELAQRVRVQIGSQRLGGVARVDFHQQSIFSAFSRFLRLSRIRLEEKLSRPKREIRPESLCDVIHGRVRFRAAVDLDMQKMGCRGYSRNMSTFTFIDRLEDATYVG